MVLDVWRERAPRLANLGYLGHMWELYAVWAWAPTFLAASAVAAGSPLSGAQVGVVVFMTLGLCGALGCLLAGWAGDRLGRARAATGAMLVSGASCLLAAAAFGGPTWLLVVLLAVWGASVIADSAHVLGLSRHRRRSAVRRHRADPADRAGLPLTVVTIQLVPVVAEAAGWPLAVAMLGIGPLLGSVAMVRLTPLLPART